MSISLKYKRLYELFKQDAEIVILKSNLSTKKFIKFRGKTYQSASMKEVFDKVKHLLI